MTLTDFLIARIGEDEATARAAIRADDEDDTGVWMTDDYPDSPAIHGGGGMTIYDEGGHTIADARHIVRWCPARVLAECAAKRRIVESARRAEEAGEDALMTADEYGRTSAYMAVLELMGEVYADHPDYLPEWKP